MLSSNFAQSGTALTPMNSPALSSNANCARAHASRARGMWRDYAKNAVERRPMEQKLERASWIRDPCNLLKSHKTAKASFGKAWRKQAGIWKSLEKAWTRLYFAIFAPSRQCRGAHRELAGYAAYLHIYICTIPCRSGKGPGAHEMWLRSLSALLLCRAAPDGKTESPGNGAATA